LTHRKIYYLNRIKVHCQYITLPAHICTISTNHGMYVVSLKTNSLYSSPNFNYQHYSTRSSLNQNIFSVTDFTYVLNDYLDIRCTKKRLNKLLFKATQTINKC